MDLKNKKMFILMQMDLEPIIIKAMDKEEGCGWSFSEAMKISEEYRKYLLLCLKNPNLPIVPSNLVDSFWHLHILDTNKYMQDCEKCFGYFLHHFPYFGMRSEKDAENLHAAWTETLNLYKNNFGEIPKKYWLKSNRCPNCGRRIEGNSDVMMLSRPNFSDFNLHAC